jgi:hypothetical protein
VFLTLGARWDANSAFGEEFDAAFYPKAAISIVPSQGLDWQNETFSTFRIRSAIGRSGLQPGAFDKFTTYQPQNSAVGAGIAPDNLGNDALKPEVSTEWELGSEVGLFNDRWSVDATYWNRTVSDALVDRQFPVTGGFVSRQLDNIGEVKAWGVEVAVQGSLLQREGLSLNLFANTAYLNEEITDLGGAPPLKAGGSYTRYTNHLVQGFAPGSFFAAKFADHLAIPLNIDASCTEPSMADALAYFSVPRNPSEFKPLALGNSPEVGFNDADGSLASHNCGTGLFESYLGKPTPDWAGSFGFNLAFANNFELASLFEYKLGLQIQDLSGEFRRSNPSIGRNTPESAALYATMLNPASTAQQRLDAAIRWAREMEALDPVQGFNSVYDADWIQWRELSLTYRIPTDLVEGWGLSTATVNLGARNLRLFLLSDYPGMDPEGNVNGRCNTGLDCNFLQGTEGWGIPIPRRLTLSTRVTF